MKVNGYHQLFGFQHSSKCRLWCSAEERKIFWKNVINQPILVPIDFHCIFCPYNGHQWLPTFFKMSSLIFGRTKKVIQIWNYIRVSKWWQNFYFGVNYPFNEAAAHVFSTKCMIWGLIHVCNTNSAGWVTQRRLIIMVRGLFKSLMLKVI